VRGLTREEREVLRELVQPGDVEEALIREQLTERGLLNHHEEVEISEDYETVYDVWQINETGRLALRVCT